MQKIRTILGYTLAAGALLIVLATYMGNGGFTRFIAGTGIKVNPRYTGGEVARTIERKGYRIMIHRPVFSALIGQSKTGFVQVDWKPDSAAAWFIVANDGSAGSPSAAVPFELAGILSGTIVDTIIMGGGAATRIDIDPLKSTISLTPLDRAAAATPLTISRVDWLPDSCIMRTFIQTEALARGKRIPYHSVYWAPDSALPAAVNDTIDCDGSGPAFAVSLDTRTGAAKVTPLAPWVLGAGQTYKLDHGWAVRVRLENCNRACSSCPMGRKK
jgi:hypothetical protein